MVFSPAGAGLGKRHRTNPGEGLTTLSELLNVYGESFVANFGRMNLKGVWVAFEIPRHPSFGRRPEIFR